MWYTGGAREMSTQATISGKRLENLFGFHQAGRWASLLEGAVACNTSLLAEVARLVKVKGVFW